MLAMKEIQKRHEIRSNRWALKDKKCAGTTRDRKRRMPETKPAQRTRTYRRRPCGEVASGVGGVAGAPGLGAVAGVVFETFGLAGTDSLNLSPMLLFVPTSTRRRSSSVTSSARTMCGVMAKTISFSWRSLFSWAKRYPKIGILASHG